MTTSRGDKRQFQELLGMSPSAAERRLRKAVMLELARQLKKNICLDCGLKISEPDDLAVVHVEEWRGGPSYFDLSNVAFSHASCRAGRHDRRQGEREMTRVEVTVEDSRGNALRGCMHEGQLYVAGDKDQRYQVRVRNRTGKRLCLVVTVDGRNVNTGKKGSWDGSGFVLDAYRAWVFEGWRQSNDSVAAFRLGAKGDAYSSQMGSAENVGIIGVAVFEEAEPKKPIITIRETQYVPYPASPYHTIVTGGTGTFTERSFGILRSRAPSSDFSVSCSTIPERSASSMGLEMERSVERGGRRSPRGTPAVHRQELGTEYGETLQSQVRDTVFERSTNEPVELHLIRYDSVAALEKAGILRGRPSERPKPQAFPASPEVTEGFCAPPARRRFR